MLAQMRCPRERKIIKVAAYEGTVGSRDGSTGGNENLMLIRGTALHRAAPLGCSAKHWYVGPLHFSLF